jgi:hypothetical protein
VALLYPGDHEARRTATPEKAAFRGCTRLSRPWECMRNPPSTTTILVTHLYRSLDQLRRELPSRLASGEARVLKQYRGNGGNGVWKVESAARGGRTLPSQEALVRARHAMKGCASTR